MPQLCSKRSLASRIDRWTVNKDIVATVIYSRRCMPLLFNLLFLSFELSRYCSLIGSFM